MEVDIIEKVGSLGIGIVFSYLLLQMIKEQMKDLRQRVETQASLSLRNDQQMTKQIFSHGERIRRLEALTTDLSNILEAKRKRDPHSR